MRKVSQKLIVAFMVLSVLALAASVILGRMHAIRYVDARALDVQVERVWSTDDEWVIEIQVIVDNYYNLVSCKYDISRVGEKTVIDIIVEYKKVFGEREVDGRISIHVPKAMATSPVDIVINAASINPEYWATSIKEAAAFRNRWKDDGRPVLDQWAPLHDLRSIFPDSQISQSQSDWEGVSGRVFAVPYKRWVSWTVNDGQEDAMWYVSQNGAEGVAGGP